MVSKNDQGVNSTKSSTLSNTPHKMDDCDYISKSWYDTNNNAYSNNSTQTSIWDNNIPTMDDYTSKNN